MKTIIVATGNRGKLREIQEILLGFPFKVISMFDYWEKVPDIEETGTTFLENAKIKADWVYEQTGLWTMADDSGLEVDALNGEPGVWSARYAGIPCSNDANNQKLLDNLKNVPMENRTARFRCVIVLKTGDQNYISSDGTCEGKIGFTPEGSGGFGYDPLFIPSGQSETFGQLDSDVKHSMSHRGKAIRGIREKINELEF
jgi:XTP/dITP diphosphohydrolase